MQGNLSFKDVIDNGEWNIILLGQLLPVEVVQEIAGMAVPSRDVPDAMTWVVSTSGRFSLFSAFREIQDALYSSFMSKQCWHTQVPLKISFFMLQLIRDRLHLDDVLTKF